MFRTTNCKQNFSLSELIPYGLLGLCVVVAHVWMFVLYRTWIVFGYDTGFYRRYLLEPLTSIPHASVPGLDHTVLLPRIILDTVRLLGFSTDVTLLLSYGMVIIFFLLMFYLWVKETFSKEAAYWAVLLVVTSPLYFYVYWSFLFKNILAFGIFFAILLAWKRQCWWLVIPLALVLPVTHQSTTILAGIIFFAAAGLGVWKKENWHLPILSWAILSAVYLIYHPTIATKVASPPVAAFLSDSRILLMLAPLLGLAIYFWWRKGSVTYLQKTDFIAVLAVAILFPLLGLPFHERVYPLLLLMLACIVGYGLSHIALRVAIPLLLLICTWYGFMVTSIKPPLLIYEQIAISTVKTLPETASVLSPNHIAPWLHGYTVAKIYAPGMFKDPFTPQDWEYYWSGLDPLYNRDFLNSFPQPLYMFAPVGFEYFLPPADCYMSVSPLLYLYTCHD